MIMKKWFNQLFLLLLLFGFLGLEPCFNPSRHSQLLNHDNLKLVLDTRAQVALSLRKKIFNSLDQLAPRLSYQDKLQLVNLIYRESQEQGVDPRLIVALIKTESGFRNEACSLAGARGLMQLRLPTARQVAREMGFELNGIASLHEPHLNIKMGAYYLAKMFRRFESMELALTAYNMGPTAVGRLILAQANIPQKYSRKVLKNYRQVRQSDKKIL